MTFEDREEAFENKFKHDKLLQYRAVARRNMLMGLWVAEQLGLKGEEAQHYARVIVQTDLKMPGDEDVLARIRADLEAAGIEISDHRLHKRLHEFFAEAKHQIMTE